MKKRNLLHFIECLLLFPLFLFLAFFMRLENDLFFTLAWGFPALAVIMQIVYLYVVADSEKAHPCGLIPIDVSDLLFLYLLLQTGCSVAFLTVRNVSGFSVWTALTVYLLLLIVTVLLMVIPAPAEPPVPAPTNERDDVSEKKLSYYANYLKRLCRKCEYAPLNEIMIAISALLVRLDTAFSVQLQTLEDDISSKCVKVENALLTGDHTKLPLLTRELEATLDYMQKRVDDYRYLLTDEGFCQENDEIAMAQIDHVLDKLGLEYEEDLPTVDAPFINEFFYQKAILFASEDYRNLLESYNAQIVQRLADEQTAREVRRDHRMRHLRRASHAISVLLMACCIALPAIWHLSVRPQGFSYTLEEDTGSVIITGYNPFYGDDLTIPATLNDKKVIAVGKDSLKGGTLTSLTLEEGVERLEYQSIRDNESLTTLTLPKSLIEVGNYATYNLPALTVYYAGTEEDWAKINIKQTGNANDRLVNATIYYGS